VSPTPIRVVQGEQQVPATIVFARGAGTTGAATLTVDRLPSTVTATVSPNPLAGDTAQLRLDISPNHPSGGIRFVVRARVGQREVVDSVDLITQLFVPPDAGLLPDVSALTVTAGGSAILGVQVRRTGGYAAPVTPDTLATTDYGSELTAIVQRRNFLGTQFHPERSGTAGARVLQNFLRGASCC